jgi:hypothetical protein
MIDQFTGLCWLAPREEGQKPWWLITVIAKVLDDFLNIERHGEMYYSVRLVHEICIEHWRFGDDESVRKGVGWGCVMTMIGQAVKGDQNCERWNATPMRLGRFPCTAYAVSCEVNTNGVPAQTSSALLTCTPICMSWYQHLKPC